LIGDEYFFDSDWDPTDVDNDMVFENNLWIKKYHKTFGVYTEIEYKVAANHSLNVVYPNSSKTLEIWIGTCDVIFTFNPATKELSAELKYCTVSDVYISASPVFIDSTEVVIECENADEETNIYYTLNNDGSAQLYNGPFIVKETCEIAAWAERHGYESMNAYATLTCVQTPELYVDEHYVRDGYFIEAFEVSVNNQFEGVTYYYTINGGEAQEYGGMGGIFIEETTELVVWGVLNETGEATPKVTATYVKYEAPVVPELSLEGGLFIEDIVVTIVNPELGVDYYYTIQDEVYDELYVDGILVNTDMTITVWGERISDHFDPMVGESITVTYKKVSNPELYVDESYVQNGYFVDQFEVSIDNVFEGVTYYYTINGGEAQVYDNSILIEKTTELTVWGVINGTTQMTEKVTATYIKYVAPIAPELSVESGLFTEDMMVTIVNPELGVDYYYTIQNKVYNELYVDGILIVEDAEIIVWGERKAEGFDNLVGESVSKTYTKVYAPELSQEEGLFDEDFYVEILNVVEGAIYYYTINGEEEQVYNVAEGISINKTTDLVVWGVVPGTEAKTEEVTVTYTKREVPAVPTIDFIKNTATVVIECETEGADIYYAIIDGEFTDGMGISSFFSYSTPIQLNETSVARTYTIVAYSEKFDLASDYAIAVCVVGGSGEATSIENVTVLNVYVSNGTIIADSNIEIFTITGQNVTDNNGSLATGVYVVKGAGSAIKVVVK
jgi:hypothetical protein